MEPEAVLFASVFVCFLGAGVFIVYLGIRQRSRELEMHHMERMAMIERGQIPLPPAETGRLRTAAAGRSMSIGILMIGFGLGLAMLITFAGGASETGIGLGGAVATLGAAFIVRSIVVRAPEPGPQSSRSHPKELP